MAEIINTQKSKGRRRPAVPRVDLTPMVDLGFLLIAFFMFTTTLARPKTMELSLPQPAPHPATWPDTATISLMPVSHHRVAYYRGTLLGPGSIRLADMSPTGIRFVLLQMQAQIKMLPGSFSKEAHVLHVLIKPTDDCTYEDAIGLLDEMNILDVSRYAMVDPTETELSYLHHIQQ